MLLLLLMLMMIMMLLLLLLLLMVSAEERPGLHSGVFDVPGNDWRVVIGSETSEAKSFRCAGFVAPRIGLWFAE